MSQWLPLYNTHPEETARIIKTFIAVFPDSMMWYNSADLLLLGFNGEIRIDVQKMESMLRKDWDFSPGRRLSSDLAVSYLGDEQYNLNHIENLLAGFLMGPEELREFSSSGFASRLSLITDNHPDLEYTFLKYKTLKNRQEWLKIYNAEKMEPYLAPLRSYFPSISRDRIREIEKIRARYMARLYAQAYSSLAKGEEDLDKAIGLCKKALEYDPTYGIVYNNLGVYYRKQGKIEEAISSYQKAATFAPLLPEAWYGLGGAYWATGQIDDAVKAWSRTVEIKPSFAEAHSNLGSAYAFSKQYSKAIEAYTKAVSAKPDYASAYYNLGLVYEDISQRADAIDAYRKAIKIDPGFVAAHQRLNLLLRRP